MATLSADGGGRAEVFQWHGDTFDLPVGAVSWPRRSPSRTRLSAMPTGSMLFSSISRSRRDRVGWLKQEKEIDLNAVDAESNRIYRSVPYTGNEFLPRFFQDMTLSAKSGFGISSQYSDTKVIT